MKPERCFGRVMVSVLAMTMPIVGACCRTIKGEPCIRSVCPEVVKVEPVHNQQEFVAAVKAIALEVGWSHYEIDMNLVGFEESDGLFFKEGEWSALVWFPPYYHPWGYVTVFISPDGDVMVTGGA